MAAEPAAAAVDWDVLRRIADDVGTEDVAEVIRTFARDIEVQAEMILRTLERAALGDVEFRAHRLGANAAAVGASGLAARARAIEERSGAGDIEAVRRLVSGLREQLQAALAELQRFQRMFLP